MQNRLGLLLCLLFFFSACCAAQSKTYVNPVVETLDLPDPGVMFDTDTSLYYAATTSQSTPNAYPIRSSKDLVNWDVVGHIFPSDSTTRPKWAVTDFWAPEIHSVPVTGSTSHRRFLAVFAARDTTGILCVGLAFSDSQSALGPWKDVGAPFVRNASVGMIDPHLFVDPETLLTYLVWKEDGNGARPPEKHTPIWAQLLDTSKLELTGSRIKLIENTLDWEGPLVEAPFIIYANDMYYLFYSCNAFYNDKYAVGVARSKYVLGPYEKLATPVVHSNEKWAGPGHCSVVPTRSGKSWAMVYHSWLVPNVGAPGDSRLLMADELQWTSDGWPQLSTLTNSPSTGPVPYPT
eukprot:ANDGO_00720.mRNA.1 Intracellular endo-alpha-(1->5)-L-arabinanase